MRIVFITKENTQIIKKIQKDLGDLGHEITLCSGNIFTLTSIPFKLRIGDIYFYSQKKTPDLIMKIIQKVLFKPVVPLEKMPKEVYAFEKRCYKEYNEYFRERKSPRSLKEFRSLKL